MKISSKLISNVLKNKFTFDKIKKNNVIFSSPYAIESDDFEYLYTNDDDPNELEHFYKINLDSFCRLGCVWSPWVFRITHLNVDIYDADWNIRKTFGHRDYEQYPAERIIEALEWVINKLEEKDNA